MNSWEGSEALHGCMDSEPWAGGAPPGVLCVRKERKGGGVWACTWGQEGTAAHIVWEREMWWGWEGARWAPNGIRAWDLRDADKHTS